MEEFEKIYEKNDELEIRFKLPESEILNILSKFSNPTIINSVCIYVGSKRKESFYNENFEPLNKFEYVEKTIKLKKDFPKYKIVLSSEKKIEKFEIANADSVIVKKRKRFEKDGWYFDFTEQTLIKNLQNIKQQVQNAFKSKGKLTLEVEDCQNSQNYQNYQNSNNFGLTERYYKLLNFLENDFLFQLQGLLKKNVKSLKQALNNPVMLSKIKYEKINPSDYMVSSKSDGKRCLLKYFDEENYIEFLENKITPHGSKFDGNFQILDCEKIEDKYLCCDVINNMPNYQMRINEIPKNLKKDILPMCSENIKKLFENKDHKSDGLIFTQIKANYYDAQIYKWKPANQLTFDFLIVPYVGKQPPFISNKNINTYLLMCGCAKNKCHNIKYPLDYKQLLILNDIKLGDYNPVPFSLPEEPYIYIYRDKEKYDLCVGEFLFVGDPSNLSKEPNSLNWELIKIRDDKTVLIKNGYFGNDYFVAEEQFAEIKNPLTIEDLIGIKKGSANFLKTDNANFLKIGNANFLKIGNAYFETEKTTDFKWMTSFNSYVKYQNMKILEGLKKVIDIGSGKGQDIQIFNSLNIEEIVFVEPDKDAVEELKNRIRFIQPKFRPKYLPPRKKQDMKYEIKNCSFWELGKINGFALNCNFALHYILETKEQYKKFAEYCSDYYYITLTFLDSEIVDKFLPFQTKKFFIKKIDNKYYIKHHFAEELYPENVINTELLIKEFAAVGFELYKKDSFGKYIKEYCKIYDNDDENDKLYVSFYQFIVFKKI